MPIKIPNDLPAFEKLQQEGVRLIGENEALRQDVRPMQVALLNLMPEKPKTETQLARLLGATPLQVELTLLTTSSYRPNTVPLSHLQSFYRTWDDVQRPQVRRADHHRRAGRDAAVRGGQVLARADRILDWSRTHVHSSFHICWGAQAALYHFHGVPKHALPTKRFGVYTHHVSERHDPHRPALMRGFDDYFLVPVSRHTEVRAADLPREAGLEVLATSNAAGLCLLHEPAHRTVYMFNHLEYDTYTLHDEFCRDRASRADVSAAVQLLSRRRSGEGAAQLLARLRAPAVRQLDQRDLPDHALRDGADRSLGAGAGGLRAARGTSSRRALAPSGRARPGRGRSPPRPAGRAAAPPCPAPRRPAAARPPGRDPCPRAASAVRRENIPASSRSTTHRPPATGCTPSSSRAKRAAGGCGRTARRVPGAARAHCGSQTAFITRGVGRVSSSIREPLGAPAPPCRRVSTATGVSLA